MRNIVRTRLARVKDEGEPMTTEQSTGATETNLVRPTPRTAHERVAIQRDAVRHVLLLLIDKQYDFTDPVWWNGKIDGALREIQDELFPEHRVDEANQETP